MKKRLACLLLSLLLAAALLPSFTLAEDGEKTDFPLTNEEQFGAYVHMLFYGETDAATREAIQSLPGASDHLAPADYALEQALKTEIIKIAKGERTDTRIKVDLSEYGYKTSDIQDFTAVFYTLMYDCACEMYWFGRWYSYSVTDTVYEVDFAVEDDYRGASRYEVDPTAAKTAVTAANNAKAIVAQYADKSDIVKLYAYRDTIVELVDYNYDAYYAVMNNETINYTNPWQIIWVFDNDPETKVVCEGYAKAYQYLCDQSKFKSSLINCYSVSGNVRWANGGGGGHMWNLITMDDGRNYLVDITACDTGGDLDSNFIQQAASGSVSDGFTILADDAYSYDAETRGAYSDAALTLSSEPYTGTSSVRYLEINETNFPDSALRQWIIENLDVSGNAAEGYYMTEVQAMRVNSLDLSSRGIADLTGIEHFTYLSELDATDNSLTSIDVSSNKNLQYLDVSNNQLGKIDVSGNPRLLSLRVDYNSLTALSVLNNPNLYILTVQGNSIASLDLSANPELRYLFVGMNKLTALDISRQTELFSFTCNYNALTELDVSNSPNLSLLWVNNNQLTKLDVSQNTELTELRCQSNRLATLDLRANEKLETIYTDTQTIPDRIGHVENGIYSFDLTQIVPTDLMGNVSLTESAMQLDKSTGIVTFPGEVRSFSYSYDTGFGSNNGDIELPEVPGSENGQPKGSDAVYMQVTVNITAFTEETPSPSPTATPTAKPTATPTAKPTATPTATPTVKPTATPTAKPTATPTATPTVKPTAKPTATPTAKPTATPTVKPTATPTTAPTPTATVKPTATPTTAPTPTPAPLIGDVDLDGTVTALDAAQILRYLVRLTEFNETQKIVADVNGDGVIDASDASLLLRKLVKLA